MKLGFIGVGYMGRHMARNLLKGDHDLTVFDIRKEAAGELLVYGSNVGGQPPGCSRSQRSRFHIVANAPGRRRGYTW